MTMFFSVLIVASSLSLIISVMMQEGKEGGLGTISGNSSDSLWGSHKGTSKEVMLQRVTIISSIIFMISALALAI